jgi:hypothetical protein
MENEAGSSHGSLKAIISDSARDVRLSDGEKSEGMAKRLPSLCITLKDHESVKIGEDIRIRVYRHMGKIRLVISADKKYSIVRPGK